MFWVFKVRIIGLEPTRLAAPDPKSGMSTNFTISACNCGCKDRYKFEFSKHFLKKNIILFFVLLNLLKLTNKWKI